MRWEKIGHLFRPQGDIHWMRSHAACPVVEPMESGFVNVFFTSRDDRNRSHIGSLVMDMDRMRIVEVRDRPVLAPGEIGLFDDSGVAMGCIAQVENAKHLYYIGWNLKVTVPWLNSIGLAIYNKSLGEFVKTSRAPVMDRSDEDPFSISYPWILRDQDRFRMWYGSNLQWGENIESMQHVVKHAESYDGVHWCRSNKVVVGHEHPDEFAIARPQVLKDAHGYRMWYSYRSNKAVTTYRIGFAESTDGLQWKRRDADVGIDVSESGWDAQMIAYGHVFDHSGERFILYNGNSYGATGFGIARLVSA